MRTSPSLHLLGYSPHQMGYFSARLVVNISCQVKWTSIDSIVRYKHKRRLRNVFKHWKMFSDFCVHLCINPKVAVIVNVWGCKMSSLLPKILAIESLVTCNGDVCELALVPNYTVSLIFKLVSTFTVPKWILTSWRTEQGHKTGRGGEWMDRVMDQSWMYYLQWSLWHNVRFSSYKSSRRKFI